MIYLLTWLQIHLIHILDNEETKKNLFTKCFQKESNNIDHISNNNCNVSQSQNSN